MYKCEEHNSSFMGDKCPTCTKKTNKKIDIILACILSLVCFGIIGYTFGITILLYSLVAGASTYLIAEARFRND